ncbi:MAG TPA: hypothetical protein VFV70_16500 [Hyphomonadaceae bacterium]|nr:hypothetical protein [Hyphomonadaceae bacterium]
MKLIRRTILAAGIASSAAFGVIATAVAEQHGQHPPAQQAPVTKSLQGDGPSADDPMVHSFYDLLVEARARGLEKVDAGLEKKIRDMLRGGPPGHGLDAKAWEDHVVDMAGQMLAIGKKDPKVFASYENFVIGLRGPQ